MQNKRTSKPLLVSLLCSKPFYALKFADNWHVYFGALECFSWWWIEIKFWSHITFSAILFHQRISKRKFRIKARPLSKTEKTTASYSSGLHWECLVSDVSEKWSLFALPFIFGRFIIPNNTWLTYYGMGSTAPSKNENLKKHPVKCTFYRFLLTANYPTSTTNTHR